MYVQFCEDNGRQPLNKHALNEAFQQSNLSLYTPKKDMCDVCISHEVGNVPDDVLNAHILEKEAARNEKELDKAEAIRCLTTDGPKTVVISMDLQSVLLAPRLNASAL